MSSKTHRTTASRRPTEEPAQSERKSSVNGSSMNDGDDLGPDNPGGNTNQNCAEFISDGDPENTAIIHSIKSDNLHGEDKGGGEREHTHSGDYMECTEEMDTRNITIEVGSSGEKPKVKPYFTSTDTLRTLANGYIDAIKEIHRHIEGTRRRIKWTRVSQASKGMAHIWDRWTDGIDWEDVSQEVSDECYLTKDRWVQMERLPSADDCSMAIQTAREHEYLLQQKNTPKDHGRAQEPRTESERFWRYLRQDYQRASPRDIHRHLFDEKSTIQLIDGISLRIM